MFTTANRATRLTSISFAVLMTLVVNGSLLMTFDNVAQNSTFAQVANSQAVAVLKTVTIVGRRI